MDRDALRDMILEQEIARPAYEHTVLTVRFADSPEGDERASTVWRIEGAAGSLDVVVAELLADISVQSGYEHPPSFDLTEDRNIMSWGADGASWQAVLTVASFALSAAGLIYQIVRDRLAESAAVENGVYSSHTLEEAREYAEWFVDSTRANELHQPDHPSLALVEETQEGASYCFTFTDGVAVHRVRLESVPGHPLLAEWTRVALDDDG